MEADANRWETAEDNMNVQLKDITVTARDGRVSHLDQVYIRGSHVRFFIVPDMLRFVALRDERSWTGNLLPGQRRMLAERRLIDIVQKCADVQK